MKQMWESPEVFEAYALIDHSYWLLDNLRKDASKPVEPIVQQIDATCGFDANKQRTLDAIEIVKDIIEHKKFIEADYSNDKEMLEKLESL